MNMQIKQSKILVIDDDLSLLELFELCLNELGYVIHTVANSQEALELIKKENFDLVFADIYVPPLSGFAVLEEIKSIRRMSLSLSFLVLQSLIML